MEKRKWSIVMAEDEAPSNEFEGPAGQPIIRSMEEIILDLQKKKLLETNVVNTEIEIKNNNKTFLEDSKGYVTPIINFSKDKFEDFTESEFVSATTDEVMRQLGLTARAGGEGAASLVGVFYDPVATILNLGSKFTGGSLDIKSFSSQVSNILNELGVPEPETETERVVNMIGQGMTAGGGSASLAKRLTNFFTGVSKKVSQIMAANPMSQTIAGGSAGGSGQVASEMGYGPIAQFAASLFGGLAGAKTSNVKTTPISQTVKDTVKEATASGVPVLTSDVRPPTTFASKWLQTTSETTPVIGTGIIRKGQQDSRIKSVLDLARNFGVNLGDNYDIISKVASDLLRKRSSDITKYSTAKKTVINSEKLNEAGTVDVSRAVAAIDQEIAKLSPMRSKEVNQILERLRDWRGSLLGEKTIKGSDGKNVIVREGQSLQTIELLRKQLGESFESSDLGSIKKLGKDSLKNIYGPLREDMRSFIQSFGNKNDIKRFDVSNARLSELAGELENGLFKRVLSNGEVTPENIATMLFSKKPSDLKLLFKNLDPTGRANARTAIISDMFKKSLNAGELGEQTISPEVFKTQIKKKSNQLGIFFNERDLQSVEGLGKILALTQRASQSNVAPKTGSQLQIPLLTAILVDTFGVSSGLITYGSIGAISQVLESPAVRNILIKLPKVNAGSPQEANLVKRLDDIIMKEFSNEEETGNIEGVDVSNSSALQSLIKNTDPSLLNGIN